jgi:hypothetical protein
MTIMTIHRHDLTDEEQVIRLLRQAEGESDADYRQRLLERATGTRDPRLQQQRSEIISLLHTLKTRLAALDAERDEQFIEQISKDLIELDDSLPGSVLNLRCISYGQPLIKRGRSF